jgi:hypothetical protein
VGNTLKVPLELEKVPWLRIADIKIAVSKTNRAIFYNCNILNNLN